MIKSGVFHMIVTGMLAFGGLAASGQGHEHGSDRAGHGRDGTPDTSVGALTEEARALAKRFMTELKGELQAALQEGGPPAAIEICRTEAPGIAGELSQAHGWAVGRTALRVRNPRNAPSLHERAVLISFADRAAAGEGLAGMEHTGILEEGGIRFFHYMKAIPTAGLCLTCHGDNVDAATRRAIRESYPADAATGFAEGELRGAFTFVKPLERAGMAEAGR